MSRTQWEAVAAAKRIAAEQKIKGVHGMLIELFHVKVHCRAILRNSAQFCAILSDAVLPPHHVKDDYYTAVETAAGNQLFQMVVDDDEIAAKMIKEMQKQVTRRHCHRLLRRRHRHCQRLLRRHHRRQLHLTSSPPLSHRTRAASPSCRSRGCAPATTRRTRSRRT